MRLIPPHGFGLRSASASTDDTDVTPSSAGRSWKTVVIVLALAVSAGVLVERASTAGGSSDAVAAPEPRDPWLRPFTSTSIWNMPIGSNARYAPANMPYTKHHALETSYLIKTDANDPVRNVYKVGHWRDRCTGNEQYDFTLHLPDGWQPKPVSGNVTPNNPGVFLQPDGRTLLNMGAMARCTPNGPLYANRPGTDKHITDLYGDGLVGAHGASRLSQLGGAIRPGEMNGDEPIRHALDLLVWSEHLYWGGTKESSYRWPATSSDRYAGPDRYRGNNSELRMGSLMALPPNVTPESLGIDTHEGRKIFAALQDYGAYITDDSAWDATYIGVDSLAIGTFPWGDAQRDDMAQMIQALHVVTNNGAASIGGGGTPRQPLLPELVPPGSSGSGSSGGGSGSTPPSGQPGSPTPPPSGGGSSPTPTGPPQLDLESADRLDNPFVVAPRARGQVIWHDPFDGDDARVLAQRSNPRWTTHNGDFQAIDGSARVTTARGDTVALVAAGTADVTVSSSITLSSGRASPGLAVRSVDDENGIIVSMVVRNGANRISVHSVRGGSYTLLAQLTDAGLRLGATYDLEVTADGRDLLVRLDGRTVLRHQLDASTAAAHSGATTHGLRVMSNGTSDDGGSRWNDVVVRSA